MSVSADPLRVVHSRWASSHVILDYRPLVRAHFARVDRFSRPPDVLRLLRINTDGSQRRSWTAFARSHDRTSTPARTSRRRKTTSTTLDSGNHSDAVTARRAVTHPDAACPRSAGGISSFGERSQGTFTTLRRVPHPLHDLPPRHGDHRTFPASVLVSARWPCRWDVARRHCGRALMTARSALGALLRSPVAGRPPLASLRGDRIVPLPPEPLQASSPTHRWHTGNRPVHARADRRAGSPAPLPPLTAASSRSLALRPADLAASCPVRRPLHASSPPCTAPPGTTSPATHRAGALKTVFRARSSG